MMDDITLMNLAIEQARAAMSLGEVPVGCAILHVPSGKIIGRGHNRRETSHDPTSHAEILAIQEASRTLGDWRLLDCKLSVTLEPCPMCAGAIVNARIPHLIYGCADPKAGAVRTLMQLCDDPRLNHRVQIVAGILAEPCSGILSEFFQMQRAAGKK